MNLEAEAGMQWEGSIKAAEHASGKRRGLKNPPHLLSLSHTYTHTGGRRRGNQVRTTVFGEKDD